MFDITPVDTPHAFARLARVIRHRITFYVNSRHGLLSHRDTSTIPTPDNCIYACWPCRRLFSLRRYAAAYIDIFSFTPLTPLRHVLLMLVSLRYDAAITLLC